MSFVHYTVTVSRTTTTTNSGGDIFTPTPTNQAIANSGDDGGWSSGATIGIVAGSVGTTTVFVVIGVALAMCSRRKGTAGGGGGGSDGGGSATTVQSAGSALSDESVAQRQYMIGLARELASRPTTNLN